MTGKVLKSEDTEKSGETGRIDRKRQGGKIRGGNKAPLPDLVDALLSYEHQKKVKLRRTGPLRQPRTLYPVAGGYWLLRLRL